MVPRTDGAVTKFTAPRGTERSKGKAVTDNSIRSRRGVCSSAAASIYFPHDNQPAHQQGAHALQSAEQPAGSAERPLPAAIDDSVNPVEVLAPGTPKSALQSLLTDVELAAVLGVGVRWVQLHQAQLPGHCRLGKYLRFRRPDVEAWLGSLDPLLKAQQAAAILKVPVSWVYANADQIPGVIRLGGCVRFRPTAINQLVGGSEVVQ